MPRTLANVIRRAWVDAALKLWLEPIRDLQRGQPSDAERLEALCQSIGWGGWFGDHRGDIDCRAGASERWCGIGQSYIGREMLPDVLEADVRLHPEVASTLLPSTSRMYNENQWNEVELPQPSGDISDLETGVLATVGSGPAGSHIVLVREVFEERYTTVECHGTGVLGDGKWGQGVVRRYDAESVEDYEGDTHTVRSRPIEGIKQIYLLELPHFVGSDLPDES